MSSYIRVVLTDSGFRKVCLGHRTRCDVVMNNRKNVIGVKWVVSLRNPIRRWDIKRKFYSIINGYQCGSSGNILRPIRDNNPSALYGFHKTLFDRLIIPCQVRLPMQHPGCHVSGTMPHELFNLMHKPSSIR